MALTNVDDGFDRIEAADRRFVSRRDYLTQHDHYRA
jgi:hypothetical protein